MVMLSLSSTMLYDSPYTLPRLEAALLTSSRLDSPFPPLIQTPLKVTFSDELV